jgi:hypothetical protein
VAPRVTLEACAEGGWASWQQCSSSGARRDPHRRASGARRARVCRRLPTWAGPPRWDPSMPETRAPRSQGHARPSCPSRERLASWIGRSSASSGTTRSCSAMPSRPAASTGPGSSRGLLTSAIPGARRSCRRRARRPSPRRRTRASRARPRFYSAPIRTGCARAIPMASPRMAAPTPTPGRAARLQLRGVLPRAHASGPRAPGHRPARTRRTRVAPTRARAAAARGAAPSVPPWSGQTTRCSDGLLRLVGAGGRTQAARPTGRARRRTASPAAAMPRAKRM